VIEGYELPFNMIVNNYVRVLFTTKMSINERWCRNKL